MSNKHAQTHTHTNTHIYIYIYVCVCMSVCFRVCLCMCVSVNVFAVHLCLCLSISMYSLVCVRFLYLLQASKMFVPLNTHIFVTCTLSCFTAFYFSLSHCLFHFDHVTPSNGLVDFPQTAVNTCLYIFST